MHRAFELGQELDALVIDVDERGRVKVSKTALERAEEDAQVRSYQQESNKASFGTFADLLKEKL